MREIGQHLVSDIRAVNEESSRRPHDRWLFPTVTYKNKYKQLERVRRHSSEMHDDPDEFEQYSPTQTEEVPIRMLAHPVSMTFSQETRYTILLKEVLLG